MVHNGSNLRDCRRVVSIGLDKSGYQVNIFLISPQKHVVGTH